jgi:pimeloyl-ACP methyl ester carboxylesterase
VERVTIATLDGSELSAVTGGADRSDVPIILVHGLASNARLWDGVASKLIDLGHPVAAVDQRGHGQSSKPETGYDFETLTSDLLAVIAQLGWAGRSPFAAGQSWGGNVVLELAARDPMELSGIALVDGGTIELSARFADWPTCEAAMAPPVLIGTRASDFERLIRTNHPDWPESGISGTLANVEVLPDATIRPWLTRANHMRILRHMWEHHPSQRYGLIDVPTLMLVAEDRSNQRWMTGKRREIKQASTMLKRSDARWIEGDHDLHAQHPELVADLIHGAATSTFSGSADG